jgi:hypothetical protein
VDETKMLTTVLKELKINFVDEKAKGDIPASVEPTEAQK